MRKSAAIGMICGLAIIGSAMPALAGPTGHRSVLAGAPWRLAGPGWAVAEYSASTGYLTTPSKPGPTTLYLTSPLGRRYAFHSWPGSYHAGLIDWSGDRQRVLAEVGREVEQVSLGSGKVISKFRLPAKVILIGYTRPDGLNLLAARW